MGLAVGTTIRERAAAYHDPPPVPSSLPPPLTCRKNSAVPMRVTARTLQPLHSLQEVA